MNTSLTEKFVPILLGSDINVYGMARSFYEAYGMVSEAYGAAELAATKYSKIVNLHVVSHFNEDPTFIETMRKLAKEYENDHRILMLIPCGDGYTELLARHKDELTAWFVCPTIDTELQQTLSNKVSFYETCEKYGLPYPKTMVITKDMMETTDEIAPPFSFPVALKPADSVSYLDVSFEGRKKAYIIENQAEFQDILNKIYENGYTAEMICQDFIPGDDSHMRVLNAYVDQHHQVRMMCLGHPLLEDPTPGSVGNYMAIMPDFNDDIYRRIKKFLEEIEYTGFANFDMKYDARDGEYKLFEINLRQGRSSFYVTLFGYNLAKYITEDYVLNKPFTKTTIGHGDKLWIGAPVKVLKEYIADSPDKEEAMDYIQNKKYGSTIFFKKDMNLRRFVLVRYMFYQYHARFKKYFKQKKG